MCQTSGKFAPLRECNTTMFRTSLNVEAQQEVLVMSGFRQMNAAYWALRIMLGLGVLLAGADKFTHFLANWEAYISPYVLRNLPVPAAIFMQIVGIVEIVVGMCILSGLSRAF